MNTAALTKYLFVCMNLEKEKYTQERIIKRLNSKMSNCQEEFQKNERFLSAMSKEEEIILVDKDSLVYEGRITPRFIEKIEGKEPNKWLKPFLIYYFGALGVALGFLTKSILLGAIGVIAGVIVGVFLSKALRTKLIENNKQKVVANAEKIMREQTAKIERLTARNNQLSMAFPNYEKAKNNILTAHKITVQTLQKYYAMGIIPLKYRDLIPVCMFYDYLINQRTYSLARMGADEGAINMYEDECYKRLIVSKLDAIIDKLDDIKSNQSILYATIADGNAKTQRMLNSINDNVVMTNQNLQFMQYQNEQIKKCAEYSAYSW